MVRRANKKIRGKESRKRKKLILIGTEGKNKTETNYLNGFKRSLKTYSIIFSSGNDTDPIGVVNNTVASINSHELDFQEGDLAYSLIDYDVDRTKSHQEKVKTALKKAQNNNIDLLISNPTFEIWFLQHFRQSTKTYVSSNEVIEELKRYIPNYKKNSNVFPELISKTVDAIQNAKELEEYHIKNSNEENIDRCPNAEVYKLIELLYNDCI